MTHYKICILGDNNSGKSSFVSKYTQNVLITEEEDDGSHPEETLCKRIVLNNRDYQLEILDTALSGSDYYYNEDLQKLAEMDCIVISYGVISRPTFESVTMIHDRTVRSLEDIQKNPLLVLVGNKADLEEERQVSREEAESLARNLGFDLFYECSAKTGLHLDDCFKSIVERLDEKKRNIQDKTLETVLEDPYHEQQHSQQESNQKHEEEEEEEAGEEEEDEEEEGFKDPEDTPDYKHEVEPAIAAEGFTSTHTESQSRRVSNNKQKPIESPDSKCCTIV